MINVNDNTRYETLINCTHFSHRLNMEDVYVLYFVLMEFDMAVRLSVCYVFPSLIAHCSNFGCRIISLLVIVCICQCINYLSLIASLLLQVTCLAFISRYDDLQISVFAISIACLQCGKMVVKRDHGIVVSHCSRCGNGC